MKINIKLKIEAHLDYNSSEEADADTVQHRIDCCQEELELAVEEIYRRRLPEFNPKVRLS